MANDSSIIFITGGVRSGKSRFAEKMAMELLSFSSGKQLHYIAAMQASDSEMNLRISRHQEERLQSGYQWKTWEQPISIGELAPFFQQDDIVLLDCLTTWLNNELFFVEDKWQEDQFRVTLFEKMYQGISAISQKVKCLIIVSNEVLYEPMGNNDLVFSYHQLLGKLHQSIVANAHQAFLVEAGIPVLMKGEAR
ncbi:bifunctional adenosylcobinamide kinase/adenosylcobinamide-phosphate guanylyltransferase [Bacillus sp. V3B]|uniref:bifunctional adenosylcobinamide kinase/adenosylcobinamide-phosphate guanylyltransferase n=1 Tax=Bacillus sp. V3B TaxID=2804915 RepID=UPI00210F20FA|nr:bifunctional adenosylcobinamide kinase/adenosylcobinamide-phosphate guanylyltransferase [Bacillus sp. V3B]MCQ6276940.1 bifunctional adenosylcobinamide kinase/adenosylcobinamide-phosphate guanylyltransferase [Bacillus sp. V3B]